MKTLVDQFEVKPIIRYRNPQMTLVDLDIEWEETNSAADAEHAIAQRGHRMWSSEE